MTLLQPVHFQRFMYVPIYIPRHYVKVLVNYVVSLCH